MASMHRNMLYQNKKLETAETVHHLRAKDILIQPLTLKRAVSTDKVATHPFSRPAGKACTALCPLINRVNYNPDSNAEDKWFRPMSSDQEMTDQGYGYNTHYSSFKSLDPSSFIFKMSERMDSWNPPESWKRITCIMMIRADHQNKDITIAAQCSLNTVKTIRHELETCNGDYEYVARRKIPSRRSDCVRTAEFLANLQEQVLKNPGIGIRALSREMNVAASTMKLALNEDLS
ncbi:hypothetical protein AAG570_008173 [Ranatra chinensis]|uniref:Uncharacterized protein n=1 Tax=Ranatra chinensis TaxID=642074 RepID=A0ABD0XSE0_9HEMI